MTKTQPLHNSVILYLPSLLFLRLLLWQKIWDVSSLCPASQGFFLFVFFKFDLQNSYSKSHFCIDECIIEDSAREVRFTCILLGKVDVAEHPSKRYKVIKTHHDLSGRFFLTGLRQVWCWRWQRNTNTQGLKRLSIEEATREHDPLYFEELKGE